MTAPPHPTDVVPADDAVDALEAALGDPGAYVLAGVPAGQVALLAWRLTGLGDWWAYLDKGGPDVLRTSSAELVATIAEHAPPGGLQVAAVIASGHAAVVAAFGEPRNATATHPNVIAIHEDGNVTYSRLFIAALMRRDPALALQILADDVRRQS